MGRAKVIDFFVLLIYNLIEQSIFNVKSNGKIIKRKSGCTMYEEYAFHDVAVYAGYIDDETKLLQSASGGIATALTEYVLAQGGYVAGVAYSEDFHKAGYVIIHDIADIDRLKGAKYIECDKNNVYSNVKKLVDAGETVLFFGLPCLVAALYAFLGTRPKNLLTCELVCHGPTYSKVHSDYLKFLEKKYKSKVIEFSTKKKIGKWTSAYLYAKFENGKVHQKLFYETEYGYAFNMLSKPSCYNCKFKGDNRQADIMIGDFWGATEDDEFWNNGGISSIFAETDKGNAIIKSIPSLILFPLAFERAVEKNPMVVRSKRCSAKRDSFAELLQKKGLIYAVNHTKSFGEKAKDTVHVIFRKCIKPIVKAFIPHYRR